MKTPNASSSVVRQFWLSNRQLLIVDSTVLVFCWGLSWTLRFEGLGWLTLWREAATNHLIISVPLWLTIERPTRPKAKLNR